MATSRAKPAEEKADDAKIGDDAHAPDMSAAEAEADRGYRGTKVDQTPDHAYTVEGAAAGEDVPEAAADPTAARAQASKPTD